MNESALQEIVLDCLASNYDIENANLRRLPGENLNFLVTSGPDSRYVCKIVGDDAPREVVELENAAIGYAASNGFGLDLPTIQENKFHNLETCIKLPINSPYRLRLMHFIRGKSLAATSDISINLLKNVGESLARFCTAMRGFEHPAAHRDHRWNLATAGRHEQTIRRFDDRAQRALLSWAYQGWREAQDRMERLHWEFVHGDAHDENWMVEEGRVSGLVDFGDCCHNPAVCDLAICLAYLMMRGPDPLRVAAAIGEGYEAVRALSADERAVLYPLVCTRLAVSLCIAMERRAIDASNPNWFSSETPAWRLLGQLQAVGREQFLKSLR
jgi:Ser/Thr protein kinase RdoA (MazF antagonist)